MAKGSSGIKSSGQVPTKARIIDNMNEAQLDIEIKDAKAAIARAEKAMDKNNITNSANAKALQEAFPLGVGGDGWSAQRKKARDKGLERDAKRAKQYTEAYNQKKAAEARLKSLENAKKQVAGTDKTLSQIREEATQKAIKETPTTLKWKTTQKGGWSNGAFAPKIISAGNFQIHGENGFYTIYENGKRLGSTDKLSKAKAYVERRK